MWKPRKNGSATMVSMTSNKTSLEAAAVDAGTTKRAEAGRIVIVSLCAVRVSRAAAHTQVCNYVWKV